MLENCTAICISNYSNFNHTLTCEYVKHNCQQDTIDFIITYFCNLKQSSLVLLLFTVTNLDQIIFFILMFHFLSTTSDKYLQPSLKNISESIGMS